MQDCGDCLQGLTYLINLFAVELLIAHGSPLNCFVKESKNKKNRTREISVPFSFPLKQTEEDSCDKWWDISGQAAAQNRIFTFENWKLNSNRRLLAVLSQNLAEPGEKVKPKLIVIILHGCPA